MSDHDLLDEAKAATYAVYAEAIDEYHNLNPRSGIECWDGATLARDHLKAMEAATAKYPESIAVAAIRAAAKQFIEAHLGAEFDDTDHEDEMRRLMP